MTITSVEKWSDEEEAYSSVAYIRRPGGLLRLADIGTIRIVATVEPPAVPALATRGCARLWAFREVRRPTNSSDGPAPTD